MLWRELGDCRSPLLFELLDLNSNRFRTVVVIQTMETACQVIAMLFRSTADSGKCGSLPRSGCPSALALGSCIRDHRIPGAFDFRISRGAQFNDVFLGSTR